MKKEIAHRWTQALRSKKFKQGRGIMRDERGYCCLGVLCELAVEDGLIERRLDEATGYYEYGGNAAYLPTAVIEWAGIKHGMYNPRLGPQYASSMNDNGQPFDAIADAIERNVDSI